METAQSLSKDVSVSCPLDSNGKVNSGAKKGEDGILKDGANSFLLTLFNMLVCSNSQPLNTILDKNGVGVDAEGASDQIKSLIGSIGEAVVKTGNMWELNIKGDDTEKDFDTANLMNMILLPTEGQLIKSDNINEEDLKNKKLINDGLLPVSEGTCTENVAETLMDMILLPTDGELIKSDKINEEDLKNKKLVNDGLLPVSEGTCTENVAETLINLDSNDGNKAASTTGAISDITKMEIVKNMLLKLTAESCQSNDLDGDCDLTCNRTAKKEASDNVKMVIDAGRSQSAIKIGKGISDLSEKPLQDNAIISADRENKGNEVDGNSDISGDATVQNENRENVKVVIDGIRYQLATKDQKILGEHSKKTAAVQSEGENGKNNNDVEGSKAKSGHINDLEKFGLGVGKTSVTVNSQESSIGSNKEIISPKNQEEALSAKTAGNIIKSDGEKFAGNKDKDDSQKNNNHAQNEKTLKGPELGEPIKNNKTTNQATHEYTITTISNKKESSEANIHFSKDLEIDTDKNIDSQLFTNRQNEIKNSELSAQTKSGPTNDKQLQSSILSQVIDRTSVILKNGLSSMEIRLRPETLGNLRMHISTENNQVSIKIVTENQHVKEIIENNIIHLKNELQSQGMEITKVEVVADHDPSHNNSNQGQSKFAPFVAKSESENIDVSQEQWDINHEDGVNDGRISFFA